MITTTLNKIREHTPCKDGWETLLRHLGKTQADDEPLPLVTILESNGLDDVLWCLRAVEGHDREMRLYAVACARRVQHLMKDHRSINALDVAERYAEGQATDKELEVALATADAAANAVNAEWAAAFSASWAADAAAAVARDAAWAAAMKAAGDAAGAAAGAAWAAAMKAAGDAARDVAGQAERKWQIKEFKRRFG
jgi:hypothetical protein